MEPWSKPYYGITFVRCGDYELTVRRFDTFILAYVRARGATTWLAEFYFGKGEVKAAKQALENYAHTLLHGGH
jgi:TolA-binding protein